ncbi:MAG: hypothetical protein QOG38_3014, partial [Hyphomicrobiales bacterium]|nr:hypothetical protein [Hyphomicrobiales bacterium]
EQIALVIELTKLLGGKLHDVPPNGAGIWKKV